MGLRLALQHQQVTQPLRRVARDVVDGRVGFDDPEMTRNIVMRPANGSATVFQTHADARRRVVGLARRRLVACRRAAP